MYAPQFRINNKILVNIGRLEGAKEVIANSPIVPSFEKQFQTDAALRVIHHGTHIEGNDLTLIQTQKVLEGAEISGRPRDVQEVINYRNVVKLLDNLSQNKKYSLEEFKSIHAATVYKLVPEEKTGALRSTQVVIREEGTGRVILSPPSSIEVPFLLEDFFSWLNSPEGHEVHPVLRAGITHYVLVAIHPFVEGNGRAVRAFATLILLKEGYDIKRFFALEEHFDKDLAKYYQSFAQVDHQAKNIGQRDLTAWLEYFTEVVAFELIKIRDKVRKISIDTRLKVRMGEQVALSERQMRLLEYLGDRGYSGMQELKKVIPMVSEDTTLRDINDLIAKNLIRKRGRTKGAYYEIIKE